MRPAGVVELPAGTLASVCARLGDRLRIGRTAPLRLGRSEHEAHTATSTRRPPQSAGSTPTLWNNDGALA